MSIQDFEKALKGTTATFKKDLMSGSFDIKHWAISRSAITTMESEIQSSPGSVLVFENLKEPKHGFIGPSHWKFRKLQDANTLLFPHLADDATNALYVSKHFQHIQFTTSQLLSISSNTSVQIDRQNGTSFLIRDNPNAVAILRFIVSEFPNWFGEHAMDTTLLNLSSKAAFAQFLEERPDLVALFRLSQSLPPDVEIDSIPVDRPAMVQALSIAIAFIPIVGNMVALYEAYAGRDIFGFRLTDLERGILAASVLLPIAGRLAKFGRAVYTEARLVKLYGRDAATWSRAVNNGASATALSTARKAIRDGEASVRSQAKLAQSLANDANAGVAAIIRDTPAVVKAADAPVASLFNQLLAKHSFLKDIDELAFQRIVEKGANSSHSKGQLLEELLESVVVPNLSKARFAEAFGINTGGKKIEFIAGHLIRDSNGRQITDGILAFRNNGVLEIVGIFEAKAGKHAARELSLAKGSLSSLTQDQRAELRAYAKDVLREEREIARQTNRRAAFTKTIADVEAEIKLSELGGQVRRDIERLDQNGSLMIGGESVRIRFSPTKTKFFGVLPKDVKTSLIENELKQESVNFEIMGIDITQKQLNDFGVDVQKMATDLAKQ